MEIFRIENLRFAYPDMADESGKAYLPNAITDMSMNISQGEFVVILGSSGCGKTTFLRQLKPVIAPKGRIEGNISFKGEPLTHITDRQQAEDIGFVMQDVDAQLVTDKVWHELAFGLESLGYDNDYIRRRVAEMSSFFGLTDIFHRKVTELSGGQKQLVNLASAMAVNPDVLILDEPTSQLDPIAANEFIGSLVRINRELGTTIIMTEHRLEEVLPVCSRAVIMEDGHIIADDKVAALARGIRSMDNSYALMSSMPAAVRIYMGLAGEEDGCGEMPVTVSEGRIWLEEYDRKYRENKKIEKKMSVDNDKDRQESKKSEVILDLKDISFRYNRDGQDILKKLSLSVFENEILIINGSNGSGKSTLLSVMAGIRKPYSGKIKTSKNKTVGMLPQDPKALFIRNTVRAELADAASHEQLEYIVGLCHLEKLLDRHPYDLSGGEQQRLALAKVLMHDPDIILMDEPTKGLDNGFKQEFNHMLHNLKEQGKTIVIVSHDIEFCGDAGERIALLFDGELAAINEVREYFAGNSFYTTAAARIAKNIVDKAVTVEEIIEVYRGKDDSRTYDSPQKTNLNIVLKADRHIEKPSLPRLMAVIISSLVIICCFIKTVSQADLTLLIKGMAVTGEGVAYMVIYGVFICAVICLLIALKPIGKQADEAIELEGRGRGFTKSTIINICVVLLVIPFTIWLGYDKLHDRKYYFISLMVLIEAMLPFFVSFESRKPKTREIVTIAVMCALAVAGRTASFILPNFSPTMALVIISGVAFGAETGFITGAVTMIVSNIMFGQGPWTPWQMFSMGLVGFLAGLVFAHKGVRTRMLTKLGLCVFGGLVCIVVYGGIMNPASVIMWQRSIDMKMILAAYVTGFPFDVVQASATVIFLWIAARPFLEKLDRIRIKYGVMCHD
ncbi:MAG: ATP-binding cassette domain-containing protein [Coprococcus sp.]